MNEKKSLSNEINSRLNDANWDCKIANCVLTKRSRQVQNRVISTTLLVAFLALGFTGITYNMEIESAVASFFGYEDLHFYDGTEAVVEELYSMLE